LVTKRQKVCLFFAAEMVFVADLSWNFNMSLFEICTKMGWRVMTKQRDNDIALKIPENILVYYFAKMKGLIPHCLRNTGLRPTAG